MIIISLSSASLLYNTLILNNNRTTTAIILYEKKRLCENRKSILNKMYMARYNGLISTFFFNWNDFLF